METRGGRLERGGRRCGGSGWRREVCPVALWVEAAGARFVEAEVSGGRGGVVGGLVGGGSGGALCGGEDERR